MHNQWGRSSQGQRDYESVESTTGPFGRSSLPHIFVFLLNVSDPPASTSLRTCTSPWSTVFPAQFDLEGVSALNFTAP